MELNFRSRLMHGWNAFRANRDPTLFMNASYGQSSYHRPDRPRLSLGNEKSILTTIMTRIALDAASMEIVHCRLDENGRFAEQINSGLNNCLTLEANIDQTGRAFLFDVFLSCLNEGCIAIVPVDTDIDPTDTSSYTIETMRVGKVTQWYPKHIEVYLYNEETGEKETVKVPKKMAAIVENPFYSIMNEPNSSFQRLRKTLAHLDLYNDRNSSNKLDLLIQLPYTIKSDKRKEQAEKRHKEIEMQLTTSEYGIAYIDGTEKVTQLNRPVENNLLKQAEYLMNEVYTQLCMTQGVLDGTADEATMLNYYSRIIEPLVAAVVDEMKRTFLSKTARTKKQSIEFFRDPFKLVPVANLADIADKFTRNEILSSNELRQIIGFKPSKDPKADQLINSNVRQPEETDKKEDEEAEDEKVKKEEPKKVPDNKKKKEKNQNG